MVERAGRLGIGDSRGLLLRRAIARKSSYNLSFLTVGPWSLAMISASCFPRKTANAANRSRGCDKSATSGIDATIGRLDATST